LILGCIAEQAAWMVSSQADTDRREDRTGQAPGDQWGRSWWELDAVCPDLEVLGPAHGNRGDWQETDLIYPVTHSLSRFTVITFVTRGTILTLRRKKQARRI